MLLLLVNQFHHYLIQYLNLQNQLLLLLLHLNLQKLVDLMVLHLFLLNYLEMDLLEELQLLEVGELVVIVKITQVQYQEVYQ